MSLDVGLLVSLQRSSVLPFCQLCMPLLCCPWTVTHHFVRTSTSADFAWLSPIRECLLVRLLLAGCSCSPCTALDFCPVAILAVLTLGYLTQAFGLWRLIGCISCLFAFCRASALLSVSAHCPSADLRSGIPSPRPFPHWPFRST